MDSFFDFSIPFVGYAYVHRNPLTRTINSASPLAFEGRVLTDDSLRWKKDLLLMEWYNWKLSWKQKQKEKEQKEWEDKGKVSNYLFFPSN